MLALDRFGDWAGGAKVTAPVRETAAQALSVLLRAMDAAGATQVAEALLAMQAREVWEVRHGSSSKKMAPALPGTARSATGSSGPATSGAVARAARTEPARPVAPTGTARCSGSSTLACRNVPAS